MNQGTDFLFILVHIAKEKIKESVKFKVGTIPVMEFETTEQRKFFKQLLEYKKAV